MAVSTSDLVQRVRDILGERPYLTTSTTTTTATTIVLPSTTGIAEGSILEWQTGTVGYEQVYVRSVTNATDLSVIRGYNGTTAETHTSGDTLAVFPGSASFSSGRQIQQHLTQSLNNLWPYVYKTGTVTLTPDTTTIWYNLNTLTVGIVGATQLYGSSSQYVGRYGRRGNFPFEVDYNLPTTLVASGKGMRFPSSTFHASNTISVTDMRILTGTSDIEDSAQFPVADCLVYSAVGRIVQGAENRRVLVGEALDTVGTVGTGVRLQTGAWYSNEAKRSLEDLAIKYDTFYNPVRMLRV